MNNRWPKKDWLHSVNLWAGAILLAMIPGFLLSMLVYHLFTRIWYTFAHLVNAPHAPADADVQPIWGLVVLSGLISGAITGCLHHGLVRPTTAPPVWWRLLMSAAVTAATHVLVLSQY